MLYALDDMRYVRVVNYLMYDRMVAHDAVCKRVNAACPRGLNRAISDAGGNITKLFSPLQ